MRIGRAEAGGGNMQGSVLLRVCGDAARGSKGAGTVHSGPLACGAHTRLVCCSTGCEMSNRTKAQTAVPCPIKCFHLSKDRKPVDTAPSAPRRRTSSGLVACPPKWRSPTMLCWHLVSLYSSTVGRFWSGYPGMHSAGGTGVGGGGVRTSRAAAVRRAGRWCATQPSVAPPHCRRRSFRPRTPLQPPVDTILTNFVSG